MPKVSFELTRFTACAWEGATAVELRGAWFQRRQQRGITRAWLHVDLDVIDQAVMPAD